MGLLERLFGRKIDGLVETRVQQAVKVLDDQYWTPITGNLPSRGLELAWYERREMLENMLALWRGNPLAYRLTELMTDFVVGSGVYVRSEHPAVQAFIDGIWAMPENDMALRLYRWCDELGRSGELFIVISQGNGGMPVFRELPALVIDQIELDEHDREKELRFHELTASTEGRWWLGVEHPEALQADQVVVHFAVNQPAGCVRGMPDLQPVSRWLQRYDDFLADRVRVQKYKGSFLWHCKIENPAPGEIEAKRAQYARQPTPGSILVTDASEEWDAINPQIGAFEAEADGHQLRLFIAAGAGVPLHFLSEGESATRATAREMGNPTYRQYAHRQLFFGQMLEKIVTLCCYRVGMFLVGADLRLSVEVEDLTKEDNEALALSLASAAQALATMRNYGWVDDSKAASIALKFAGEMMEPGELEEMLRNTEPINRGGANNPGLGQQ